MTEPNMPSTPPAESGMSAPPPPTEPAAQPAAAASATSQGPAMAMPAWSSLSGASRLVMGGSVVVFVSALLGIIVGAWELDPYGLIALVVALVAGGAAWMLESGSAAGARAMLPGVQLAAGAVGSALAVLAVVEIVFDLDQLDDEYGGVVGLLLAIFLVGGALAILWGALQRLGGWRTRVRAGNRGTSVALAGVALVLLAWLLHLSIGFWSFAPASWGIAAIVLAGTILFVGDQLSLPVPAAWIAIVLGLFAAWTAFGQWNSLMDIGATRVELDLTDLVPFVIYVVGIVAVLAGSVMVAMAETRRTSTGAPAAAPATESTPSGDRTPTGGMG